MAVMVTGGTGFVGLNVVQALLARGEHVVAVALDDMPAIALRELATLPGTLDTVRADVRHEDAFRGLLRHFNVDRLFPFAAITSGAERERDGPEAVIDVNLLGFIAQLRAARDAGVRRVIVPSSGAALGEAFYQRALLDEATTPALPIGVYGVTKYAVERTALRLAGLWGMDLIVARIGSVFGPWERATGLRDLLSPWWQIAGHAAAGREAVLPADLPPYTWIYGPDIASGLVHLLDMQAPPHPVFHVCSGQSWDDVLATFAATLMPHFPAFSWRQSADPAQVNVQLTETQPRGRMDTARINATGWQASFGPDAACQDYARWLADRPGATNP